MDAHTCRSSVRIPDPRPSCSVKTVVATGSFKMSNIYAAALSLIEPKPLSSRCSSLVVNRGPSF
jgi:hypothetical protein